MSQYTVVVIPNDLGVSYIKYGYDRMLMEYFIQAWKKEDELVFWVGNKTVITPHPNNSKYSYSTTEMWEFLNYFVSDDPQLERHTKKMAMDLPF